MADSFIQVPPNVDGGNKVKSDLVGDVHTPVHIIQSGTVTANAGTGFFQNDGATSAGNGIVIAGVTAGGVVKVIETNASGHVNIADGGGSITVDSSTLASETTLAALNDKIQNTPSGALLTGTARERFFDNFHEFDTTNTWEVVQTGTGMAITGPLGGAVAGSSPYLNISSGTTINQKTIILSRQTFNMPVDLRYQITASQRIANNRLIIGFVQVDPVTGAILTSTTYSTAPDVLNARNAAVHQHDGTVATTAQLRVRAAGAALNTFANAFGTGFTTVATGSSPNFLSATTYGLTMERDRISARAYGQNVTTNTGGQFGYDQTLVNPTAVYKLCIIVENLGTAPASSTDWRFHLINILDATRFDVSPRNAGTADGSKAFPFWAAGGTVGVTGTVSVSAVTAANLGVPAIQADIASAALTTTTTTAAVTPSFGTTYIVNIPVTAVTGTNPTLDIGVEESDDTGTNWYRVYDFPRITATGIYRSPPLTLRGNRIRYVQTVGGTTPSFTRAINRLQRSDDSPLRGQFIDRSIVVTTLNSTSPVFYIEGMRDFNLAFRCTAAGSTAAVLAMRFSADGTNWFTASPTLTAIAGIAVAKFTNEQWKFGQVIVQTAGVGTTFGEITLTGTSG